VRLSRHASNSGEIRASTLRRLWSHFDVFGAFVVSHLVQSNDNLVFLILKKNFCYELRERNKRIISIARNRTCISCLPDKCTTTILERVLWVPLATEGEHFGYNIFYPYPLWYVFSSIKCPRSFIIITIRLFIPHLL
jgi:hypothetical protein